jgi:hypothetical protein
LNYTLKALNADLVFPPSADLKAQAYLYGTVRDEVRTRGHDPSTLFKGVPQKLQGDLSTCYSKSPSLTEACASLQEALALFDGVFEEWRYAFEGKAGCVKLDFLLELLEFFRWEVSDLAQRHAAS